MAWSFNVFTGNLDQTGSSGAVVFEGEVETFDDLPAGIGDPAVGASYLVRSSTGVWLVNRRQAGIWIRKNNTGVRATDWEYGGDYPVNSVNGQTGNVSLTADQVSAAWALTVASNLLISADTTLTAGRNVQQRVQTYSATNLNLTLPTSGLQNGDTLTIIAIAENTGDIVIRRQNHDGSGFGPQFTILATATLGGAGERFTFRTTASGSWELLPVDTHTHGNLSSTGTLGSTSGLPVVTTTAGAVTTLALGSANQVLKVNSGGTGVEFGEGGGIDDYTVITSSQTATNGARIAANTTAGAFTLTLPASPSNGDTVSILDYAGTFDTNNLTIARNGSNIESLAENMDCNIEDAAFSLVYVGSTVGWKVVPYFGSSVNFSSPNPIGNSVPSTGAFTTLTATSLQNTPIGSTTPSTGAFTTLSATPPVNTTALTLNGGTATASAPVLDLAQTWNASGTTFNGVQFTITPTNYDHRSNILSVNEGATQAFGVQTVIGVPPSQAVRIFGGSRGIRIGSRVTSGAGSADFIGIRWQQNTFTMLDGTEFGWSTQPYDSAPNLALHRDAANTLAQRNGTNAQTFRLYNTFTSTTNFERLNIIAQSAASVIIGTEKGSGGGSARGLELRTDNVARINISATGGIGFFGAAAAAQPTAVADATDAATVITQLNALLSRMRTLGLIAT